MIKKMAQITVAVSSIITAAIIILSFATNMDYAIIANPTGSREFAIGVSYGRVEARTGHYNSGEPILLLKSRRRNLVLNGLQTLRVGGLLGVNLWRDYTKETQIGNNPPVVDPAAYLNAVTVEPITAVCLSILVATYLLILARKKNSAGFSPLVGEDAPKMERKLDWGNKARMT